MKKGIDLWVTEDFEGQYRMQYKVKETLYSEESDFQKIDVVDTEHLGKVLFNDGLLMTSDRDEFVYHEMMAHVPLFTHPEPKKVLIIGGGDGGTLREVLKHESVEKAVMVEIDPCVIEACKKHLPVTSCAMDDPRAEILVEDGIKYIKETQETFDVVLIDSTDPIGPAAPLFNEAFYSDVQKHLSKDGIVVSQCENPFLMLEVQKSLLKIKSNLFSKTSLYNYSNITYPSGLWSFSFASFGLDPLKDQQERRPEFLKDLKYYTPELHQACFCLPRFQKEFLKEQLK